MLATIKYPESAINIHKGWFQDTVPEYAANKPRIALLRLDGDLYESTKVCLDHLWGLVVPNGVVVIDDYLAFEGCKKAVDEFFDTLAFQPLLHSIHGMGGRYLIKPAGAEVREKQSIKPEQDA